MAFIKIKNNANGAGSTIGGASIAGCTETIIDVDLPVLAVDNTLPNFTVKVTNNAGTSGQDCDIDVTGTITMADIYNTLNAAVEAGLADPYNIPTVSGIIDSDGAIHPITKITAP